MVKKKEEVLSSFLTWLIEKALHQVVVEPTISGLWGLSLTFMLQPLLKKRFTGH